MTDLDIRVAVARIDGYTNIATPETMTPYGSPPRREMGSWLPDYLNDPAAVIRLLEKRESGWKIVNYRALSGTYKGQMVWAVSSQVGYYDGVATTFCRAACLAMIAANAVDKPAAP